MILREILDAELELMLSWRNHPAVRNNMYSQQEISREEHLAWWMRTKPDPSRKYFMYESKGQPLGIVGLVDIDQHHRHSSWAFYASPDAPRGTGSRMEYLALEFAFGVLELNKLYCEVLSFNAAVINLHKKFGFEQEGVFKEQFCRPDGAYADIVRLAIFSHGWQSLRADFREKLVVE